MARSQQQMMFVCKQCRHSTPNILRSHQSRAFTATASPQRTIPTFTETPSEDLNTILHEYRHKVFTPAALSKTHEKLIYKKSRHHILRNDPGVSVTLSNDEEVKLEPMNRWDRPNKYKSLYRIAQILGQNGDITVWENLPKFLEGLVLAKERIPVDFLEKITRKANEVGRAGLIRRCAETSDKTGMKLSIHPVTRELFLGIHSRAAQTNFKGEDLEAAAREAEFLTFLMDKQDHCAGPLKPGETDMRSDPVVIAVVLELDAAKALDIHDGTDTDGKVTGSAQRLLALTQQSNRQGENILRKGQKATPAHAVEDWVPLANSIRLTLRVGGLANGDKDAELKLKIKLKEVLDTIDRAITEQVKLVRQDANGKPRRALKMLDAVKQ